MRRGAPPAAVSRLERTAGAGPQVSEGHLYKVVDVLDELARETGKTVGQIALDWVMDWPRGELVPIGPRPEEQLRQTLAAPGWQLSDDQLARLHRASAVPLPYPYWHQQAVAPERIPLPK